MEDKSLRSLFSQVIDDMPEDALENAVYDFLSEQVEILIFISWLRNWKSTHSR